MDKSTVLFIRACKSLNHKKRVESVYRRFYFAGKLNNAQHIANILTRICTDYNLIQLQELVDDLSPNTIEFYKGRNKSYYDVIVEIMSSKIRLASVMNFKGYPTPTKFKRAII